MKQIAKEIIYDNLNKTFDDLGILDFFDRDELLEFIRMHFRPEEIYSQETLKESIE